MEHVVTKRRSKAPWRALLWLGVLALSFAATRGARAQTPSPLAEWQYSAGIQLQRLFLPAIPNWRVELGVGSQFAPVSDGLTRYKVLPGPVIDIRYQDIAFLSTGEGLGINLFSFRHIRVGAAITYDLGRLASSDYHHLYGLENIQTSPEAKIFADYALSKFIPITLRLDVRKQIGGTDGWIGDFGAYTPLPGSSKSFAWFFGPTVTAANRRYMNDYFGVNPYESDISHYRTYQGEAGLKSAGVGVTAAWLLTPHVIFNLSAAGNRLLASAAQSPITQEKYQGVISLSALYKF